MPPTASHKGQSMFLWWAYCTRRGVSLYSWQHLAPCGQMWATYIFIWAATGWLGSSKNKGVTWVLLDWLKTMFWIFCRDLIVQAEGQLGENCSNWGEISPEPAPGVMLQPWSYFFVSCSIQSQSLFLCFHAAVARMFRYMYECVNRYVNTCMMHVCSHVKVHIYMFILRHV